MITLRPITWKNDKRMIPVKGCFDWGMRAAMVVCISFSIAFSQREGDALLGKWLTEKGQAAFEFSRDGSEYRARLIPLKYPDLKDRKNPIDSLRGRALNGATLIVGLKYDEKKKQWTDGWVYNPDDGKNYHCYCWLAVNGAELHFRGYLGVKFLGQTQVWKRVPSK
jgi:uncharacterized protein (DUF2147 family)